MNSLRLVISACVALVISNSYGQLSGEVTDPALGESFEPYIFTDIQHFPKSTFSTSEAKGKWLILDFWNEYCSACISSFPKLQKIHQQFSDRVTLVSVAYTGFFYEKTSYYSIKRLFAKAKEKLNLSFPIAFDSVLYNRYGQQPAPYIVIIDPEGKVQGVTNSINLPMVEALTKGDKSQIIPTSLSREKQDKQRSAMMKRIESNAVYHVSLSKWDSIEPTYSSPMMTDTSTFHQFTMRMPLDYLYRFAFTGKSGWDHSSLPEYRSFKHFPVLEMSDSSNFSRDKPFVFKMTSPKRLTVVEIRKLLANSLHEAFGYDVRIDSGLFLYWSVQLVQPKNSKLITKGGPTTFEQPNGKGMGIVSTNVSMESVMSWLWSYDQLSVHPLTARPYIDETGLTKNIDITLDAYMEDFNQLRAALLKAGIQLKDAKKQMQCIVITASPLKN
jgi:thiol-disulfide isomerase/thioredoxin